MPYNAEQTVRIAFVKSELVNEEKRQIRTFNRVAMLNDDFEEQVWNKMKLILSKESQEKMESSVNASLNIFGNVIDQLSQIYLEEPDRVFAINQKGNKKEQKIDSKIELVNEIYGKAKVNQTMSRVNKYMNALNDVLIMAVWRNEQVELDILTPNTFSVRVDDNDPTKAVAVLIKHKEILENGTIKIYWVVWTDTEHYILDENMIIQPVSGNEDMKNPYGKMPFVFIHKEKSDAGFWDENSGEDLYQCTIIANVRQSFADYYAYWNSFKQLAIATDSPIEPGYILAPDKLMKGPADATWTVLDFQADFEKFDNALERYISRVLERYGISTGNSQGAKPEESGVHLEIKNSVLSRYRTEQLKVLREAEQDLFELITKIYSINNSKMDLSKLEMTIDFSETKQYIDPKVELELIEKEIEMNLRDMVEVYMSRNPDYTDYEEAREKVIAIIKSNNELRELIDYQVNSELNRKEEV
jgi:hypothetical protein